MSVGSEEASNRFIGLDTWQTKDIISALWEGQMKAVASCMSSLEALAPAIDAAALRVSQGEGRLIYVGAGTSGLIAVLDSLELFATFAWPLERMVTVMPSGLDFSKPIDGSIEDDALYGAKCLQKLEPQAGDVVIGVSASGKSAFTIEALRFSREAGALTIAFANNLGTPLEVVADHSVVALSGAEVIAGSTRLGAGTAQKVLFNLFSTGLMVRLGAVHDNLMVNVQADNVKLHQRCAAMVSHISGVDLGRASQAIDEYGSVKKAVLGLAGFTVSDAEARLQDAAGNLRLALSSKENN
ncbi:N-acetylmuramic acid 6-phosphate etherase [Polycladidibacter stylochi]|uniref:N-acetylmuramic acid 6-phosphate etherase n=1 Tax=Polycladidibacter stylochi TaxID=1807766 RepID=UPI0008304943|nr:N-acetylmuramic acid 6-phosphate etherase [Pseudovibrio stylochi]